ncbi:cupin domain-containing protein [Plantactinospora sp. CA-294935]|uniref:cupin domain-containing protein n=1 Tax=Plantactinospora sp. CA-294935 TaxID=3240012 RepID=UPI003D933094
MSKTFPGGTSVTHLDVYTSTCPDGLAGGTPHLHTASTEAYVVVEGHGALHTLDLSGPRETPLEPGSTVWFTPGTIHRAINHGGLRVVVVMANAGLPEAGDAVMTFPTEIVADPARYRQHATLPDTAPESELDAAARRRRDLAVEGFHQLARSFQGGDPKPLERFYDTAAALVRPLVAGWRRTWQETVARETSHTAHVLDALEHGYASHLRTAALLQAPGSPTRRFGMCGRLRTYDVRHHAGQ